MALSMAVVPLLEGDAARAFNEALERSELKPYTDEQRIKTLSEVEKILSARMQRMQK